MDPACGATAGPGTCAPTNSGALAAPVHGRSVRQDERLGETGDQISHAPKKLVALGLLEGGDVAREQARELAGAGREVDNPRRWSDPEVLDHAGHSIGRIRRPALLVGGGPGLESSGAR